MSRHGNTLAILGGKPAFDNPLHVGRPNIGDPQRLQQLIGGMLERRWLTNDGPLLQAFESRIAERIGVRHCVAVANATLALQLVARGLGLTGQVIVPSFTFIATASALSWQGLDPVFCDVDPATHCLDPARVEELITPRTSAILAVHLWGRICDTEALEVVARRHGIPLLIDAAHAFGSMSRGRMAGCFGAAEVLSFHATKIINSFEGGAIVTDDNSLAMRLQKLRNFGFEGPDSVVDIGINAKMSEASAAMGLTSLESLQDFILWNQKNFTFYCEALSDVPGLRLLSTENDHFWNHHYVVVDVDAEDAGLTRDMLLRVLHAENIFARRYFYPGCHRMPAYVRSARSPARLPVTERVAERILQLPTGTAVGSDDIAKTADIIRRAISVAPELRRKLAKPGDTPYHSSIMFDISKDI